MKYEVTLKGKIYTVDVTECEAVILSATPANISAAAPISAPAPSVPTTALAPAAPPAATVNAAGTKVIAPMPGNILKVNVTSGQSVKAGDVLFILEAMKMENEIVAPSDGVIKQVLVNKGAVVDTDAVLAVI